MKKLFVLIAAMVICSQSHATSFIPNGSLTVFTNYSKVPGQKSTYTSKTTYSIGDDWESFPAPELIFRADTGLCFSDYAPTVEWVISDIVSKDDMYRLNVIETSEDGEEISFEIQFGKKLVKSFRIHRCI